MKIWLINETNAAWKIDWANKNFPTQVKTNLQ